MKEGYTHSLLKPILKALMDRKRIPKAGDIIENGIAEKKSKNDKIGPESVTSLANIPVKPTSAPTRGDNWVRF